MTHTGAPDFEKIAGKCCCAAPIVSTPSFQMRERSQNNNSQSCIYRAKRIGSSLCGFNAKATELLRNSDRIRAGAVPLTKVRQASSLKALHRLESKGLLMLACT